MRLHVDDRASVGTNSALTAEVSQGMELKHIRRTMRFVLPHGLVTVLDRNGYRRRNLALLEKVKAAFPGTPLTEEIRDRTSGESHKATPEHVQFWFASNRLVSLNPKEVYDIGSHRAWLLGVGATCSLHTLDVRGSELVLDSETAHIGRAEELPYDDGSIECITSLCALEHFGLGGYGDPFEPEGDIKAIAEIRRVLRSGGHYIFTTTLTGGESFVVFNTRRVYSLMRIREMLGGMTPVQEQFFSMQRNEMVDESALVRGTNPYDWDLYLGDWQKG